MILHKGFWHGTAKDLAAYRYGSHAYLWVQHIGRFTVRTWTDKDGKPIATGWFLV